MITGVQDCREEREGGGECYNLVSFDGAAEFEGFDAGAEGGRFEAEEFGGSAGAFKTPGGFFEDDEEVVAFALPDFVIGEAFEGVGWSRRSGCLRGRREFGFGGGEIELKEAAASENDGAFDDVTQFTDIAGPIVGLQLDDAGLGEAGFGGAEIAGGQMNEMLCQEWDILAAVAEGGDLDGKDIQSIIEIFAEATGDDFFFEVAIGGADNPDIRTAGAVFADAFVQFFLQDAEQFALEGQGNLTDFIKEEGAAFGGFKTAGAVTDRPGERALGVAEEFAFVEFGRDGSAVDANQWFIRPTTAAMDLMSDQFLTGAGFAKNQHGGIGAGDEVDLIDDLPQGSALADEVAEGLGLHDLFLKVGVLLFEGGFEAADFLEGRGIGDGAAGVVSENTGPDAGIIGDIDADKHADDPKHFAFMHDGHGAKAANRLGFEKGNRGEFPRIAVQISEDDLPGGSCDLAENANTKRDAGERVRCLRFGVSPEIRGRRSGGVETFGLVRTFTTTGTMGANVPLIHKPNSDRNHRRALTNAIHEALEHEIEFLFLTDFQQHIPDEGRFESGFGIWLHANQVRAPGAIFQPSRGVFSHWTKYRPQFCETIYFINNLAGEL